jgi:hypothetical protein
LLITYFLDNALKHVRSELTSFAALYDSAIDFFEVSATKAPGFAWFHARAVFRPINQQLTVRPDADVLGVAKGPVQP